MNRENPVGSTMRNGLPRPPIGKKPDGKFGVWFDDRRGESHPSSKLTGDQARWIVRCLHNGIARAELAAMLGVSPSAIWNIGIGKRYAADTAELRTELSRAGPP